MLTEDNHFMLPPCRAKRFRAREKGDVGGKLKWSLRNPISALQKDMVAVPAGADRAGDRFGSMQATLDIKGFCHVLRS